MTRTYVLNGLTLSGVDTAGVEWRTDPEQSSGLGGVGVSIDVQQRVAGDGGLAGPSYRKARYVRLGGFAIAPTPEASVDAQHRLSVAAALTDVALDITDGSIVRTMIVRRSDSPLVSEVSQTAFAWSVQMVALDPRKFGAEVSRSTGLPSTSGGLTAPFTAPFTVDATQVTGQVALTNPGTMPGPVWLRIAGPFAGPVVTHVSSGTSLVFSSSAVLPAGSWLDVDMDRHLVLENGQAPRAQWVTGRGWSSFDPGVNVWALTAATYNAGMLLTVRARPAWE